MRRAAFFPPGLHPVLDGGEGDEDAVVAPEVPRRRPIRQAIFDDQTHREGDDTVGVVATRRSEVREVGAEIQAAATATVA